jgi:predicted ATP-dependent endonuclease of OLD family
MHLIQGVAIRRFRSIADLKIATGALTVFVGANGSGKSNVLRALNLYFNGEVEPNDPFDIRRDVHRP